MKVRAPTRIVLTGAPSTGKTTLATRLAAVYDTVWLPEFVRSFINEQHALPEPPDMDRIACGHIDGEVALSVAANRLLLLDTDLISSCVYNRYYFGHCPAWIRRASEAGHADLYLLADDDIPWEPDPAQRESHAARSHLQGLFVAELRARAVPCVRVSGPIGRRVRTATAAIDQCSRSPARRPDPGVRLPSRIPTSMRGAPQSLRG